jgi:hypothetical protein
MKATIDPTHLCKKCYHSRDFKIKHCTSICVSLLSAAATSVSMFNAEPNPVLNNDPYVMLIKAFLKQFKAWQLKVNKKKLGSLMSLLVEVTAREGRTKPGEEDNKDEVTVFCNHNLQKVKNYGNEIQILTSNESVVKATF